MTPDRLESLLADGAPDERGRTAACPDEHRIAGYVDGGLGEADRREFGLHLVDCPHCLDLVGLLCRERGRTVAEPGPSHTGRDALGARWSGSRPSWRFAPQWAVAAALVLVVPLLVHLGRTPGGGNVGQGRPDPVATRALGPDAPGLQIVVERAESLPDTQRPTFRWTEVAGSPYYDVRIVTDAGDVVIERRVTGTTWRAPARLSLRPGAEYFVHVDAYPAGAKPLSLGHVPFRVED